MAYLGFGNNVQRNLNMKAEEFIRGIEKLKSKIENSDFFDVITWQINPGISIETINELERQGGFTLADEIKDLHKLADGMVLKWKIKLDVDDDLLTEFLESRNTFGVEVEFYQEEPLGSINIKPLYNTLIEQTGEMWQRKKEETMLFGGSEYSFNEFCTRLKIYDVYSNYDVVAFLRENNHYEQMLMLTGHYEDWGSSKMILYKDYLQLLLFTDGIVEARNKILNAHHNKLKPVPVFEGFDELVLRQFQSLLD